MALIDSESIHAGLAADRPQIDESDWTKLLLRDGYAELAASTSGCFSLPPPGTCEPRANAKKRRS